MKKIIVAIVLVSVAFYSCGQNKTTLIKAYHFFDAIEAEIMANKALQQSLIDRATNVILELNRNKSSIIDTKEFHQLLDSAKQRNLVRQKNIEQIPEFDNDIRYKEHVLNYVSTFSDFYEKELKDFVVLLDAKGIDRFVEGGAILLPKLKLIKEKEIAYKTAKEAFLKKYPTDKDGAIRTEADYEILPITKTNFEKLELNNGEEIMLLSYSGGPACENEKIYLRQYIGITTTGDTVRILSPCIDYNTKKPVRLGVFKNIGGNDFFNVPNLLVVFNKNQALLEKRRFKTTVGVLVFQED